jgi:hypothetical protein
MIQTNVSINHIKRMLAGQGQMKWLPHGANIETRSVSDAGKSVPNASGFEEK